MIQVCAWCGRFLGVREPGGRVEISHGICPVCSMRLNWIDAEGLTRKGVPHLVLGKSRKELLPLFKDLLRAVPEIQVMVDRRVKERRRERLDGSFRERRASERRQGLSLVLV